MSEPQRIQLSRRKGWRMPENTVSVARPGKWGNPCRVTKPGMADSGEDDELGNPIEMGPWHCSLGGGQGEVRAGWWFSTKLEALAKAVAYYRFRLTEAPMKPCAELRAQLPELRGKNLACWCPLDEPCHADVLLDLANTSEPQP